MKTIAGLFDDYSDGAAVVTTLEARGIPAEDISILSNTRDAIIDTGSTDTAKAGEAGAGIGAAIGGAGGLLTGLGLLAIPGVGPVVAAGWLASLGLGAAVGAAAGVAVGGLIGALANSGIPEEDAEIYAEAVRRGGTLVTAKVSEDQEEEAEAIFRAANAVDPDVRRDIYADDGWTRFDDTLEPYDRVAENERLRQRHRNAA